MNPDVLGRMLLEAREEGERAMEKLIIDWLREVERHADAMDIADAIERGEHKKR